MEIRINDHVTIGDGHKTFIVAEIGNNHNGSIDFAKKLVAIGSKIGVSAVKFQTKNIEEAFSQELLNKNYEVIGTTRNPSDQNMWRLKFLNINFYYKNQVLKGHQNALS